MQNRIMSGTRAALILPIVLLCAAGGVDAQDGRRLEPNVPEKAGKELRARRIVGSSPRVDGRLDEEVWSQAQAIQSTRTSARSSRTRPS